jgi:hypothetical protein
MNTRRDGGSGTGTGGAAVATLVATARRAMFPARPPLWLRTFPWEREAVQRADDPLGAIFERRIERC